MCCTGAGTTPDACSGGGGGSRKEGALEAVRQAVGGGFRSRGGRLLSVTHAIEAGSCRQGDRGCALAGRLGGVASSLLPGPGKAMGGGGAMG